jgi:hypothetical protein
MSTIDHRANAVRLRRRLASARHESIRGILTEMIAEEELLEAIDQLNRNGAVLPPVKSS